MAMPRGKNRCVENGLRLALFAVSWLLLGWPLVSLAEDSSGRSMFLYLFGVGALVVALLLACARALSGGGSTDGGEGPQ